MSRGSFPHSEIHWPRQVRTLADAVCFTDATGFCLLFPIKNLPLHSLYFAVARRTLPPKPVWDKNLEKIWRWKDELGRRCRAYYGKYFKGRGTLISLALLPHFLAMNASSALPEDHERFYAAGRIGSDARAVWQALAEHGPLATLELRHACKLETKEANARYKRAILELQRLVLVVHFGTEQETAAWASGRYELTSRAFSRQVAAARGITPTAARRTIAAKYLEWHPQASATTLARLFGWSRGEAIAAAGDLFDSLVTSHQPRITRQA